MTMAVFLDYWATLSWREYGKHMLIYFLAAFLLVLLGPFNTYGDPFIWRLSYWLVMLGFFGGVIMPLSAVAFGRIERCRSLGILVGALLLLVVSAVPMTLLVAALDPLLEGLLRQLAQLPQLNSGQIQRRLADASPPRQDLMSLLELYSNVLPIALLVVGVVSLLTAGRHQRKEGREPQPMAMVRPGISFFSRLPEAIGTDLICLQMEDHYVRVMTRQGEALILLRMRDAIQELEGVAGLQVHRSWWVATSEIVRLARQGRRTELTMSNAMRVPVSSRFRPALDSILDQSKHELASAEEPA